MSSPQEVRARWHGFLQKIEERHTATLDEATVGCLQLLELAHLDTTAMTNAWQGVSSQLRALVAKIADTWHEKVGPAFQEAEAEDAEDQERAVGEQLAQKLEAATARRETELFGEAADRLMQEARKQLVATFACTQCGSPLPIQEQVFRSYFVACQSCSTVNTFEPGTKVRQVEHFCSHWISKRHAIDHELAMCRQQEHVRDQSAAPLADLKRLEQLTETYWTMFYDKRADIVPAFLKDRDKDIAAKMRFFHVEMNRHDNWQTSATLVSFKQEHIVQHLQRIGASLAAAGNYPERIYTRFYQFFNEQAIKQWLTALWEAQLAAEVHAHYGEDLALYRQLVPTPLTYLFEGFREAMDALGATVVRR